MAEVLITLGVIGVVAAMTMPVLIANHRNSVLKNQFKKTYSTLLQGLVLTIYENGGDIDCKYQDGVEYGFGQVCRDFYLNSFFPKLKTIKICDGNAYDGGCVPKYDIQELTGGNAGCSGYHVIDNSIAAVLSDGSIIVPYYYTRPLFLFDINGKKGPNLPGYDVFSVRIWQTGSKYSFTPDTVSDGLDDSIFTCLSGIRTDAPFRYLKDIYK